MLSLLKDAVFAVEVDSEQFLSLNEEVGITQKGHLKHFSSVSERVLNQ